MRDRWPARVRRATGVWPVVAVGGGPLALARPPPWGGIGGGIIVGVGVWSLLCAFRWRWRWRWRRSSISYLIPKFAVGFVVIYILRENII